MKTERKKKRSRWWLQKHFSKTDHNTNVAWLSCIIGGSCHKYHFVAIKHFFCCEKSMLATTKLLLWQTYFCHDKSKYLSQQTCVCHDKHFVETSILLSWQKTRFVMTNMFVATKVKNVAKKWYLWQLQPMVVLTQSWQSYLHQVTDLVSSPPLFLVGFGHLVLELQNLQGYIRCWHCIFLHTTEQSSQLSVTWIHAQAGFSHSTTWHQLTRQTSRHSIFLHTTTTTTNLDTCTHRLTSVQHRTSMLKNSNQVCFKHCDVKQHWSEWNTTAMDYILLNSTVVD